MNNTNDKPRPTMTEFVLDASAVLAVLRGEAGAQFVVEHGRGSLISSVNMAEVFCHAEIRQASRERVEAGIRVMQLREVPFDRQQAEILAMIYPLTVGSSVGFADRACMALARKHGLTALTGDHDWLKHDAGVEIQLFRQRTVA